METAQLQEIAKQVRRDIVTMINKAGSGHPAGSLGMVEILVSLYNGILVRDQDKLVVSNGHICPALYSVMAHAGYFPVEELMSYAKLDSRLQSHPERMRLPGIETTSGPLGCGLGQGVGMALGFKLDQKPNHVFVIASDGEHDEGNHWEAVLLANKYKLTNLTLIVDRNQIQIDGTTEEVLPLGDLKTKYETFGWNTMEINGHDFGAIFEAIKKAKTGGLTAIIAKTVAGKGVSFVENRSEWHAKPLNDEELKLALSELQDTGATPVSHNI